MNLTALSPLPEVRQSNHGLGLFARREYNPGDTILELNPPSIFMALHGWQHETGNLTTCYSCFARPGFDQLSPCSGCRSVRFCKQQCSTIDRTQHQAECSSFRQLIDNLNFHPLWISGITEVHAVLRMICLKDTNIPFWSAVTALHVNERSNYSSVKQLKYRFAAGAIKDVTNTDLSRDEIERLFYVVETNCFPLYAMNDAHIGLQVFPLLSRANHSCEPNTGYTARFERVVATKHIRAGDELFASYVNRDLDVTERRKRLKENSFFDCDCSRCHRETAELASPGAENAT